MNHEVIQVLEDSGNDECGYCKSKREANSNYGMWAYKLSPLTYQLLIDRNWRRSGKYCYKPVNHKICCPMYTIRTDAINFKLRKSQKKVIKNLNNYIKFGTKPSRACRKAEKTSLRGEKLEEASSHQVQNVEFDHKNLTPTTGDSQQVAETGDQKKKIPVHEKTVNTSSLATTKKKFQRRQRYVQSLMKRKNCTEDEAKRHLYEKALSRQQTKSLEDYLSEYSNVANPKHTFRTVIRACDASDEDYCRQTAELYNKYNSVVHNDERGSISSFKRFLIDSPLQTVAAPNSSHDHPLNYGSYHQLYYIDERLVAVGVIDLLPKCITSVYLFYDPEYSFLNLGIYSALNEIAWVRQLNAKLSRLTHYYMGFYIHSCPKMIYKAQFQPADLLCSETFQWYDIDSCRAKLATSKYARFCDDASVRDQDGERSECRNMKFIYDGVGMTFDQLVNKRKPGARTLGLVKDFARLVGCQVISRVWYYVSSLSDWTM